MLKTSIRTDTQRYVNIAEDILNRLEDESLHPGNKENKDELFLLLGEKLAKKGNMSRQVYRGYLKNLINNPTKETICMYNLTVTRVVNIKGG